MPRHGASASGRQARQQADDEGLFRAEALAAFVERHYGAPIARMPRLWTALAAMLVVMVAASILFLVTATYARKERVTGWLMPDQGLVRLTAARQGQVERVHVEEGEVVARGAPLLTLSGDTAMEGGTLAIESLIAELDREAGEARRQLDLLAEAAALERAATAEAIERLAAERERLDGQVAAQDDRVAIASGVLERFRGALADDVASPVEVARYEEAYSLQVQSREQLGQRAAGLAREEAQLRAQLRSAPVEAARRQSELRGRLSGIARQRTELRRQGRTVVTAPVPGRVATLSAEAGSTVMPNEVLSSIVPKGSALYAQLYVPSRAIGFVEPGQRVRLMYAPFPHQRYGSAWGEVERVSRTVLRPEEIPSAIGLEEPAYEVRVRLDRQDVEAFGRAFPLRPGMALSAEVIQERRTFGQFLLEPLRAARGARDDAPPPARLGGRPRSPAPEASEEDRRR